MPIYINKIDSVSKSDTSTLFQQRANKLFDKNAIINKNEL